ncbi:MAG TPA: hypothetical protein VGY55_24935, partial [Pirellulales bacterium]|nr:hypothetical protein [Pirellulales bacterium]
MPTRLRAVVRCVLLAGVIAPPLALVALAADAPSDAKKTAPDVQPAKHRVCGTFLIHATEPAIWPAENKLDLAQFEFYKRNVAAIVKSSVVIDKALEDKGIQASPLIKQHGDKAADWLADQIAVEFPGNGEIMTVCMVAENDSQVRETRDMLNAVMEGFMKAFVYKERNDKLGRYDDLDRKFRAYKQEVLDKQRQLFDLVQAVGDKGAVALPQWKIAELKQLALEARRAEIQAELQIARTRHKLEGLADSSSEFKTVKA